MKNRQRFIRDQGGPTEDGDNSRRRTEQAIAVTALSEKNRQMNRWLDNSLDSGMGIASETHECLGRRVVDGGAGGEITWSLTETAG